MNTTEDKGCTNFEFHKANNRGGMVLHTHHPKPTPSKWDDAQKWLVGLSGSGNHHIHTSYGNGNVTNSRNSNADDRRLLNSLSQRERYSCSSADGVLNLLQDEIETKKIDRGGTELGIRSVCVRDMGTEMTPLASQDPSRTATPIRSSTPVLMSPMSSRSCSPGVRFRNESHQAPQNFPSELKFSNGLTNGTETENAEIADHETLGPTSTDPNSLECRAIAWDEAERAKYMARYKQEEMRIQAWENHEKRKAEMKMRKKEVKAERIKARSQEKMANKIASARRIAEEKRASAEAKLKNQASRTSERADYIRRTGHLPPTTSALSLFKLTSLCGGFGK